VTTAHAQHVRRIGRIGGIVVRIGVGSSPRVQRNSAALEEYREVCTFIRHDDQMAWTILTLATTVAFGLWAYALKDASAWSNRAMAAITCGVIAIGAGRLMARRITVNTQVRWQRARELESVLTFRHLTNITERGRTLSSPGINRMLDIVAVATVTIWLVYVAVFVLERT